MEYEKFVTLLRFLKISDWKLRGDNVTTNCISSSHKDDSPSFSINYKKEMFHCFGCGISGGMADLVKIKMKLPTKDESYKVLKNLGIWSNTNPSLQDQDIINKYSKLYCKDEESIVDIKFPSDISLIIKDDYHYKYIQERAISNVDGLISKFKLRKNRFKLFVPVFDENDKLVGYGNRTITDQNFLNKYPILDTPEQPKILYPYGFSLTRYIYNFSDVKNEDSLIIVEGMFDVFNVWDKGIENICATFSNKMSDYQAKLILKYFTNKTVKLLVDRDSQGMILVNYAYQKLFSKVDLNVCLIPVGKDPGECTKSELYNAINNPIPISNFIQLKKVV